MLIINASPRKKGNIAQMVAEMSEEAKNHGVEAEVVEVQNLNVRPCMGCMQCRSKRRCVLPEDDAGHVLQQRRECEALVIPTFAAVCTINSIKIVKYQQISAK